MSAPVPLKNHWSGIADSFPFPKYTHVVACVPDPATNSLLSARVQYPNAFAPAAAAVVVAAAPKTVFSNPVVNRYDELCHPDVLLLPVAFLATLAP